MRFIYKHLLHCGDKNKEQNTVLIQMEINRHIYSIMRRFEDFTIDVVRKVSRM